LLNRWGFGGFAVIASSVSLFAAGCGLGPGPGTSEVTLTVTRDFGAARVGRIVEHRVPGGETVLRLLERHFVVAARRGGSVESIDGLAGVSARRSWFYYVNGVQGGEASGASPEGTGAQGSQGAATTAVHKGDRIWWDLHYSLAPLSSPAVVGSFPEPFLHGVGGKRLPTTIECAADAGDACTRVSRELARLGVPAANQVIGGTAGTDSLVVVVGTWRDLGGTFVANLIDHGPAASGVYARFEGSGRSTLRLLGPRGQVVRTLGAGAGLVAATTQGSAEPTWVITGTDLAGVSAAAAALTPARLSDHFSLVVQGSTDTPVPVEGAS
jgi:hypothetical protein